MHKSLLATDRLMPGLLLLAAAMVLAGIAVNADGFPVYWSPQILLDDGWWCLGFIGVAVPLFLLFRQRSHLPLAAALALYLLTGAGATASLATLLLLGASWSLGHFLLRGMFPAQTRFGVAVPLLCGLVPQVAGFSLLVHVPVNTQGLYLLLQALPILAFLASRSRRAALREELLNGWRGSAAYLQNLPFLYWALLLLLAGALGRHALIPSLFFDDNALHLRLWTELSFEHRAAFDVIPQVWAVAPFAVDLLHAIASLTVGADARAALNLLLFALLCRQFWGILVALRLSPRACALSTALFISTPMAGSLLLTLQTELFLALLATAGAQLLLRMPHLWCSTQMVGLIAVAALACATKLPGAVLGLLLLGAALVRHWPLRLDQWREQTPGSRRWLIAFILLGAVAALHSYVNAWWVTGNPLFPLYNALFHSPYFAASDFNDPRWMSGFTLHSYWDLFFTTSRHHEGLDFTAGFQYLALLPLGLLALGRRPAPRHAWLILLPLIGFGLMMFSATQYWRYLFPVAPLASVVIAILLFAPQRQTLARRGATIGVFLLCLVLNLTFYPGVNWLYEIPPGTAGTPAGNEQVVARFLPERALTEAVNRLAPGSRVLYYPEAPFGALLHGDPYYPMWYAPSRAERAGAVRSAAQLVEFLRDEGIRYVIWNMADPAVTPNPRWLLREHLRHQGQLVQQYGDVALYALPVSPLSPHAGAVPGPGATAR
jgi:hypothetical protein